MMVLHETCCCALVLVVALGSPAAAQRAGTRPPGQPPPPGQTITAHDGDVVVVKPTAEVRLVRRGEAQVRAIYDAGQRSLLWLVDYVAWDGHEPDNRVDAAYRFEEVTGAWPLGARWEGRAVVEDYSVLGMWLGGQGAGLSTSAGLVQLFGQVGPVYPDLFRDKSAVATLLYQGGGRGTVGEVPFDLAESREKESMARNAERRKALAAGGVVSQNSLGFMINGTPVSSTPGAAARPPSQAPVRVGGSIKTPVKLLDVPAVLPETARQAGVTGVVLIEVTVGPDGLVKDAKVLRSIPLLDAAALAAVRQWRYEPTLLNGVPVAVITTAAVPVR